MSCIRTIRRHSIRLKGYDYSQSGIYFVTICCQDMKCRFGVIENGEMVLNECGQIAFDEWMKLPERYPKIFLDAFQIMPNHIHSIIILDEKSVRATLAVAHCDPLIAHCDPLIAHCDPPEPCMGMAENMGVDGKDGATARANGATARVAPTMDVGAIVGAYKSLVFDKCLEIYKSHDKNMGKLWQRNYHEHIIRTPQSHKRITDYIINNPKNWKTDKFFDPTEK